MGALFQDVRFAARYLGRRRAVAALAIAMLALGIGATTAMFTVVDSVLLRALPYAKPAELVEVWETFPHWRDRPVLDAQWNRIPLSYAEYRRVGDLTDLLESVGAASWRSEVPLTGWGDPLTVSVH